MGKHTRKPCEKCPPVNVALTKDVKVCATCFFTADEAEHWEEMARPDKRLAQKFAKKRSKFWERMKNAGPLKRQVIAES